MQGGVVAAFGLVRGSAQADMLQLSTAQGLSLDFIAQVRHHDNGVYSLVKRVQGSGLTLPLLVNTW